LLLPCTTSSADKIIRNDFIELPHFDHMQIGVLLLGNRYTRSTRTTIFTGGWGYFTI